jgi:hypothetical protein
MAPGNLGHVADNAPDTTAADEAYPGQSLGLPPEGRGSLASWRSRVGALIIDWAACMIIALGFFGSGVLTGGGWRAWMILATFFVESTVLSWLAGGSFGQLISRIAVVRLDVKPLGLPRAAATRLSGVAGVAAFDHFHRTPWPAGSSRRHRGDQPSLMIT